MAIEIELPDGRIVEFPDGTDTATMERALAQFARPDFSQVQGAASSKADLPNTEIGGVANKDVPGWKNALFGAVSPVAETIVGVGQATGLMGEDNARASLDRIDAVRSRTPGKVAGFAGDVGLALAIPGAKGASMGAKALQSAAAGGLYGATRGTREGEDRLTNTGIGAALGGAGQVAGDALAAGGKKAATAISPHVRATYEAAKARGINLTPAQLSNSRLMKFLDSQLQMWPLSGARAGAQTQRSVWNKRLAEALGETDAPAVTPAVYAKLKARDKAGFEALTSRNNLKVTDDLLQSLEAIKAEATMAGDDAAKATANAVDAFYKRARMVDGQDVVPGRAYQSLDSQFGKVAKLGNEASVYVGRVRDAIRDAMDESIAPDDKAAWQQLRKWYGDRKTIRDLVAKGDGDDIAPAELMGRLTANNSGKERMASNARGELGELGRIGQRLKEPPSSGSSERMLVNSAMNPLNWPALGMGASAGATVGRAANSDLLAQYLMRSNRGRGAQLVAPYLRPAGIGAAPLMLQSRRPEDADE